MKKLNTNFYFQLFVFALLIFISRLPFLNAGYGVEEDSWGIAVAAHNTATSGIFEASRLPGHPLQEMVYSALWGKGSFVFNLLTALFSTVAVVFFILSTKALGFKHYFLAGLAFAFAPVVYIASTYTIDYMWTCAFIFISFYFLIKQKTNLAALFLGLAIGCRITTAMLLIPFSILLIDKESFSENIKRIFILCSITLTVSLLTFIPVIKVYGFNFFSYSDQFPYPSFAKVFYKASLGVWGFLGLMAIIICSFLLIVQRKNTLKYSLFEIPLEKKHPIAWGLIIFLYILSYLALPQKSAYLIPVVPFAILLFAIVLRRSAFIFLCASMVLSSFLFSINLTDKYRGSHYSKYAYTTTLAGQEIFFDPLSGPVFSDFSKRKQKMEFVENVFKKTEGIQQKTLIISGWWYNEILTEQYGRKKNPNIEFVFYINAENLNKYKNSDYMIFYLPEQNLYNDQMFNMHITDSISKPLFTSVVAL